MRFNISIGVIIGSVMFEQQRIQFT